MAFKFPTVKSKEDDSASLLIKDLPSFNWSYVTDKGEIGRGSFGSVFLIVAKCPANDDLVVIKKRLLGTDEEDRRIFLKDGKLLHRLRNQKVVQFKAICESTQRACILKKIFLH